MARQGSSAPNQHIAQALRALPAVDAVQQALAREMSGSHARSYTATQLTHVARATIHGARTAILQGQPANSDLASLVAEAIAQLDSLAVPMPRPVINATGVIINTNLGRAPLSDAALEAIEAVADGYSALEYDLGRGERGSRQTSVRALLRELIGAEDALVVNNNASALLVALSALASGREVIVSRGELVEIGGGFRIPDVLRQSGARLVETGTTNRTRSTDFAGAITDDTALLLSVHPSNYRIIGFTTAPALSELALIAHQHSLPLIHDLGSGALLRTERWGLAHEPMPQESIAAGADLVCFSGDKLLGGPQAGILAGKSDLIARIEHHPLMRAVRMDKLTLAGLVATLRAYRDGTAEAEIPVWRMIAAEPSQLKSRAQWMAEELGQAGIMANAQQGLSTVGGGSMPGETLPTWHIALAPRTDDVSTEHAIGDAAAMLAARLRHGRTPVVARVLRDQVLLDPRTVPPSQDAALLAAIKEAYAVD